MTALINKFNNYEANINRNPIPQKHKDIDSPQTKYKDPLLEWPIRGMAFTNDIGAAVMDISPKLGTVLWVPALMYFGADIYDKYRNDKESYDPSARRGLKQALFQSFASIMFPIVAVHSGQKIFSMGARLGKSGLSIQAQEDIIKHHIDYVSHRKLKDYKIDEYKNHYKKALDNYIEEFSRTEKSKNIFHKALGIIFGSKHREKMGNEKQAKIYNYINKRIDNMFEFREKLLENKKPTKLPSKLFTKFQELKEIYKKNPEYATDYVDKATKDILKLYENKKIFNIKLIKTLGGFVALGLLIQPIDKFVEKVIIEKIVNPRLERFDKDQVEQFKSKFIRNEPSVG